MLGILLQKKKMTQEEEEEEEEDEEEMAVEEKMEDEAGDGKEDNAVASLICSKGFAAESCKHSYF